MLEQITGMLQAYGYDTEQNAICIQLTLNRTIDKVKNHCNISKVPCELESLVVEMCVDSFIQMLEVKDATKKIETGVGNVTSVKTGDEQTNFEGANSSHAIIKDYVDRAMKQHIAELNKFRRFKR